MNASWCSDAKPASTLGKESRRAPLISTAITLVVQTWLILIIV